MRRLPSKFDNSFSILARSRRPGFASFELDQQIDVTVGASGAFECRSEEGQPADVVPAANIRERVGRNGQFCSHGRPPRTDLRRWGVELLSLGRELIEHLATLQVDVLLAQDIFEVDASKANRASRPAVSRADYSSLELLLPAGRA